LLANGLCSTFAALIYLAYNLSFPEVMHLTIGIIGHEMVILAFVASLLSAIGYAMASRLPEGDAQHQS
jgi:hypothetical protein